MIRHGNLLFIGVFVAGVFVANFGLFFFEKNGQQATPCDVHRKKSNHSFCVNCSSKLTASRLYSEHLRHKLSFYTNETKCQRFAMVKVSGTAGLGQRFSEILFGFHLSQQTNSTFVLDEESLYGSAGTHGSYEWFRDFLPLDKTEITLRELSSWHSQQRLVYGRWDYVVGLAKRNSPGCGDFYVTTSNSCCNNETDPGCAHGCWGALFGSYEDFRWKIAEAFEFSAFRPSTDLYRHPHFDSMLSIAWHLRSGDIVLNNNQIYFETVARQLLFLTKYIPAQFFLHGQNVRKIFPFVEDICENLLSGNCSFPELNAQDTLFHLVHSDVLITSGSSFAYLAAALQKNVVINSFPKEGVLGVYELGDHGQMDREGNIFHPPVTQLRDRVKTYYFHKLKMSEHLG